MAKTKPSLSGLIRRTEPTPKETSAPSNRTSTVSVGLKQSEIDELQTIANANSVTRNNLMAYVLRTFLRDYRTGKIKLDKDATVKKQLKI